MVDGLGVYGGASTAHPQNRSVPHPLLRKEWGAQGALARPIRNIGQSPILRVAKDGAPMRQPPRDIIDTDISSAKVDSVDRSIAPLAG